MGLYVSAEKRGRTLIERIPRRLRRGKITIIRVRQECLTYREVGRTFLSVNKLIIPRPLGRGSSFQENPGSVFFFCRWERAMAHSYYVSFSFNPSASVPLSLSPFLSYPFCLCASVPLSLCHFLPFSFNPSASVPLRLCAFFKKSLSPRYKPK